MRWAVISRRIRYLIGRALRLDPRNLWRIAGTAAALSKRPRAIVLLDLLWSSVRYEVAFQDFLDWDFAILRHRERLTYMTHPKANHIARTRNDAVLRRDFADKLRFNARFDTWLGREWRDVREITPDELAAFVTRFGSVMAKVPDGLSGVGVSRHFAEDVNSPARAVEFHTALIARGQFLVEEYIQQHPTMAALCPTSVNSLRIITWFDGEHAHVLARVLKIGNGGAIDNFSNGGMYTMLDPDGVALCPAFDTTGTAYDVHPISGIEITGFAVPHFPDVLNVVETMSRVEPRVPYVGWDIAIGAHGPVVIEGNPNSGVYQAKPSVSGIRTGLLPEYRAAIGF